MGAEEPDHPALAVIDNAVADYIATLEPNEALCTGRMLATYQCSSTKHMLEKHGDSLTYVVAESLASMFALGVLNRLLERSVGATVDHAPGACKCAANATFFSRKAIDFVTVQLGRDGG